MERVRFRKQNFSNDNKPIHIWYHWKGIEILSRKKNEKIEIGSTAAILDFKMAAKLAVFSKLLEQNFEITTEAIINYNTYF